MNCLPEGQPPSIKQEISFEPSFTHRFLSVIENLENEPSVPKDSIFQWIQLFDEDNLIFLDLFEKSFLLIFKSHTELNSPLEKRPAQQLAKGYSQLLSMFLSGLIDLTAEVKLNQEKRQHIKNFIEFQLLFFSESITAGKPFIREFSYRIIITLFSIISQKLDISLEPKTQTQLLESVLYLLTLKSDDSKTMGIKLYGALTKMGINSSQINQLSLKYLENIQNYSLRRSLIRWGVNLEKSGSLDRLLNRLKDKNPLIAEEVAQKLINQCFPLSDMNFQQRIKLLVDGFGSSHSEVKYKAFKYFKNELAQILNSKEDDVIERRLEEKQVRLQTLNRSLSMSLNRSKNTSFMEEKRDLTGIQKFVRIFNYDHFEAEGSDIFRENPFLSSLICKLIFEVVTDVMSFNQIVQEIHKMFSSIELDTLKGQDCIFMYCMLRGVYQNKSHVDGDSAGQQTRKQLKRFIFKTQKIPEAQTFLNSLIKLFEDTENHKLTTKIYLLKIIELLSVHLEIYDCVGVRVIYNELIKILTEYDFSEGLFKDVTGQADNQEGRSKDNFMYLQLIKANHLLNMKTANQASSSKPDLELITGQLDLIFTLTQITHKILKKQPTCQKGELKLLITDLIQSKTLKIQKQTLINMRIKTVNDIQSMTEINVQCAQAKSHENLIKISAQIDKKLDQNQKNLVSRMLKAFFILVKTLSIKQSQNHTENTYLKDFMASSYYEAIKSYIQDVMDTVHYSFQGQLQTCWIPFMIFYYKATQSVENYLTFKKLFQFYAFGEEFSLCEKDGLLRLLSARFLVELELINTSEKIMPNEEQSVVKKILGNLMNHKVNDPIEQHFLKQMILKAVKVIPSSQEADSVLCNMFLYSIKQFTDDQSEGIYSRIFVLVFRAIGSSNPKEYLDKVMLFYCILARLVNQQKAVLRTEDKHLIFWHGTKLLKTLLIFIKSQQSQQTSLQKISENLFQLSTSLKLCEIIPEQILPALICCTSLEKLSHENLKNLPIETLIFAKSSLQKYLEKDKQNQTQEYHSIEKDFIHSFQLIGAIQEKISDEIFQRLKPEDNHLFEQQSTDHSPISQIDKNPKACRNPEIDKINFDQIESYKAELLSKIDSLNSKALNISQSIKKTNVFKSLSKDFAVFVAKYKANHSAVDSFKKDDVKIQEDQHQQLSNIQPISSGANPVKVEFDRKGRRKLTDSQRLANMNKVKGSVKKSRFLIIPYDVVENAEEKYGRKSNSKKKSRKGSTRYNDDSSYRSWLGKRNLLSQQISIQPTSSHQQSGQLLNEEQSVEQNQPDQA